VKHSSEDFVPIPIGKPIPDTPHAVSVSLPRFEDVVNYEEKEPATMAKVRSGYPRFVRHNYIEALADRWKVQHRIAKESDPILFASEWAAEDALQKLGTWKKTD